MNPLPPRPLPAAAAGKDASAPHMPAAPSDPLYWRAYALGLAFATLAAAALEAVTRQWEHRNVR